MNNLGGKLKKLRTQNNYTQEEISRILDVKREVISYYENDERQISSTNLETLLRFYGLTKKEFLSNDEIEANIQVAYRKDDISVEEFEEIAWLNNFVANLNELKKMNK